MKKRMIAIALLIVMLFALSACGGNEQAAPAAQPAAQTDAPAADQPADQTDSEVTAVATENAIPDGSGVVTLTSKAQGFSIDFDSDKYVAMENPVGNIDIFAGQDEGIPKCTVSLRLKENTEDAAAYLKSVAQDIEAEKGKDMVVKAGEPQKIGDRDIYYIAFTFKDKEAGGNVQTAYYAQNLKSGDVAVFTSSALEGQTEDVDAILKLAVQSFKFGA
ncbi:MAG: hypothetical protein Q4E45_00840 [Eubacteriales bacterium]|nr:hypothetical protein [Eubacteriales bacterium]